MRRATPGLASLLLLGLAAIARAQSVDVDAVLRWDGERLGTLGPTGRHLYAEGLEPAPGLRGRFGWGGVTPGFVDPLRLTVLRDGAPLPLEGPDVTWHPSHRVVRWHAGDLQLVERQAVTDDDGLLDELTLRNAGPQERSLELRVSGAMTPLHERFRSEQTPVELGALGPFGVARLAARSRAAGAGDPAATVPRRLEYDGVAYALPPLAAGGEAILDPGERSLPLPEGTPALATLHALCLGPPGEAPAACPELCVVFDDGRSERVSWPPPLPAGQGAGEAAGVGGPEAPLPPSTEGGGPAPESPGAWPGGPPGGGPGGLIAPVAPPQRVEWLRLRLPGVPVTLLQLSYRAPPGRFIQSLDLPPGTAPDGAALLAVTLEVPPSTGRLPVLMGQPDLHGLPVHLALAGDGFVLAPPSPRGRELLRLVTLPPGGTARVQLALVSGRDPFGTALGALARVDDEDAFARHVRQYQAWFDANVPAFTCSDPLLEKAWAYRWFLVRHAMLRLDVPGFSLPVFFAGLGDADHALVDAGSSASILREVRWLADTRFAQGQIRSLLQAQLADGGLCSVGLGRTVPAPAGALPAAAIDAFAVNGSLQYLKEVLPLLQRAVVDEQGVLRDDGTPAPWEFASARALARGWRVLGEEDRVAALDALAEGLRAAWLADEGDVRRAGFVPDLPGSDVIGIGPPRTDVARELLPLCTGLLPDTVETGEAFGLLLDSEAFWGRWAVGGDPWAFADHRPPIAMGAVPPCVGVCSRGPWANASTASLAGQAFAAALRSEHPGPIRPAHLLAFLRAYARMHFEGGRLDRPLLRGCVGPGGGEGCIDPLHDAFADLLVRCVGGLMPRTDGVIELWPLVDGLDHFAFRGLHWHGHRLDIAWDPPDGLALAPDTPEGYTLEVDGELLLQRPTLEHVTVTR